MSRAIKVTTEQMNAMLEYMPISCNTKKNSHIIARARNRECGDYFLFNQYGPLSKASANYRNIPIGPKNGDLKQPKKKRKSNPYMKIYRQLVPTK